MRSAAGFTVIEALVALLVLLVGLLATFGLINVSNSRGAATRAREDATNVARQIADDVRSIKFAEVSATGTPGMLQAMPGLADGSTAPGWQVVRRKSTYAVSVSICKIDDPIDGYGVHPTDVETSWCADSTTAGTADGQPTDFKRVSIDITWQENTETRHARLSSTISAAGQAVGIPTSDLELYPANQGVAGSPPGFAKITSSATSLSFRVTAPAGARSIVWAVDGQVLSPAAVKQANGTEWRFTWNIAPGDVPLVDGTYGITARAVDDTGVAGPAQGLQVQLIRQSPAAPSVLFGGYNTVKVAGVAKPAVELQWIAGKERNVLGYRVYRPDGSLACPGSTSQFDLATSCVDLSPAAQTGTDAARTYKVVALYRDASDALNMSSAGTKIVAPPAAATVNRPLVLGLQPTTALTGTNCTGTTKRDMVAGYAGAGTGTTVGGQSQSMTFCSAAFLAGDVIKAGASTFVAPFGSASGQGCDVTAVVWLNGVGGSMSNLQNVRTAGNYTFTASSPVDVALAAGDRVNLTLNWANDTRCNSATLKYGAAGNPGKFWLTTTRTTPGTGQPPVPTGLTAAAQADGTVRIAWTAPADTSKIAFYRVYKDGTDVSQRIDATGAPDDVVSFDTTPNGTHDYYVTAVSPQLTESPVVGPVRP